MDNKNLNVNMGGFWGLLTIVFITLKLLGVITWSWWWVLAPLWMPISIVLLLVVLYALLAAFVSKN